MADVVRDEDRPHGHEHLAADHHRPARVDERLVADEDEVADGERRPGIAPAAAAHAHVAPEVAVGADERAAALHVEPRAEARQRADGEHLVALDDAVVPDLDAVLEHDPRRDDDRALAEPHAFADRGAGTAISVAALVRGERAERVGVGRSDSRKLSSSRPSASGSSSTAGRVTPSSEMPAKSPGAAAHLLGGPGGDEPLDVLRGDEAVLLDRGEVDAVLLGQLDRPPRGVGGPCRLAGSAFAGRALLGGGELLLALGDDRDAAAQLDLVPWA